MPPLSLHAWLPNAAALLLFTGTLISGIFTLLAWPRFSREQTASRNPWSFIFQLFVVVSVAFLSNLGWQWNWVAFYLPVGLVALIGDYVRLWKKAQG